MRTRYVSVVLVVALVISALAAVAQQARKTEKKTIPKYTVIPLVLDDAVSSKTAKVGDRIESHCVGPNCGGFPVNTTFVAVITEVGPPKGKVPAHVSGKFVEVVLPDGKKYPIEAVLSTPEGVKRGPVTGKAKPGGKTKGAAVGTVAGALVGVPVAGGAVGWAFGAKKKGKTAEVQVPAGTKFHVMLTKPATIEVPARRG